MRIRLVGLLILSSIIIAAALLVRTASAKTINFGNVTLSSNGSTDSGHFDQKWNITAGDITISFTYDANGLVDDGGCHAWAELGLRAVGYSDFNPTWMGEGVGVWLATDFDWTVNTFDPDPVGAPVLDLDDKLILQKGGGWDESHYDLPSPPPNPWANHGVWFDRDSVDPWQDDDPLTPPPGGSSVPWGSHNGATYNTAGLYHVVITLHATSSTAGTAYMTVNGEQQGFFVPNYHAGPPDLYPAGMTFTFPEGKCMQVFYGLFGYGAVHSITFEDVTVTGVLCPPPVGGEWVPMDNAALMIPWLTTAIATIAVSASFIFTKRWKNHFN